MQYTIRNVPDYLDAALRESARRQGKSLNEAAVQALVRGAGLHESHSRMRDLADLAKTWVEDRAFDKALAGQDTIDQEMWPVKSNTRKQSRKKTPVSARTRRSRTRTGAAA